MQNIEKSYNIKVLGVGGGGSNTIDYIVDAKMEKLQTYSFNTDEQALKNSKASSKIRLGRATTKGLGAGALPEIGFKAAKESEEDIRNAIEGADIVFIASGMGGGTGTGAAPFIANVAKSMGILTIAVVTKPFNFEGKTRMEMALEGIGKLNDQSDVTLVIPNERLIHNHGQKFLEEAFLLPDHVLYSAIKTIVSVLFDVAFGTHNIDLNMLRKTLSNKGLAVISTGECNDTNATGVENIVKALDAAIDSDMLEISINGARSFICQIEVDPVTVQMVEEELVREHLKEKLGYEPFVKAPFVINDKFAPNQRRIHLIAIDFKDTEFIEKIINDEPRSMFEGL